MVWGLKLDSTGAQFDEALPLMRDEQVVRTVTRVRVEETWLIRWSVEAARINPFWAMVDEQGVVWDIVSVREVGRRRHLQLDCTRTLNDPRRVPA